MNQCPYCKAPLGETDNAVCVNTECILKFEIDHYKKLWGASQAYIADNLIFTPKLTPQQVSDTFRILMLSPSQMDSAVHKGQFDSVTTARIFCRDRHEGWEKCSPETLMTFLEIFEEIFKHFSEIAGKANKKILIREFASKKATKDALARHAASAEKQKTLDAKEHAPKLKQTPYQKAVDNAIRMFNCTRAQAEEATLKMGIKP